MDHRITVRLPDQLFRRLKSAARRRGIRQSEIIRQAIERQFDAEEESVTAFERVKKAGIIGAVKGASTDLSTNPKYFDGFGSS